MSPKKIFITIGLVAIVIISGVVLYFLSQKRQPISQDSVQNQEGTLPAALPSETRFSGNQENVAEARKIFENAVQEAISDQTKEEGSIKIDFKNPDGSQLSLSDFKKALDIEIPSKLQEYLSNGYQLFYCPGPDGKKEYGAYLDYNQAKIYRGFTYDVSAMMKSWEATILSDLHTVLYPDSTFSDAELRQKLQFKDGKYKYAEVNLPGGKKGSIQYDAIEFGVIVAASPSCLDKVYQYYEPSDP
jgi:hypothetical protein